MFRKLPIKLCIQKPQPIITFDVQLSRKINEFKIGHKMHVNNYDNIIKFFETNMTQISNSLTLQQLNCNARIKDMNDKNNKELQKIKSENIAETFKSINLFLEQNTSKILIEKKEISLLEDKLIEQKNAHEIEKKLILSNEKTKYDNLMDNEIERIELTHKLELVELQAKCNYQLELIKELRETVQSCKFELVAQRELTKNVANYRT
ncbi:hypothetical protein BMW23_0991 [Bodo saltans virus]|uniref:Uncharacterized protein n=1 Tax=Bodo saltans virus TaxID=2024608 RepID=A0A2H4UVZ2_9VIRU|nr:hypothetical protein QJ851_gp0973 [Bodo saltans virus]ATZ81036.1 hypothetical protein BMW23_0991 [Bodo saltans virus]